MYALVDGNNFFASCERVFRPDLEGKPVLVLSNNDGCVIARSAEVKALGVPMGVPFFEVKALCRRHHVQVFSSNYRLYGDMSNRMMRVLANHAREVAPYSIDECFLDLGEGPPAALIEAMRTARRQVRQHTGLPVCIGLAPTKVLAKAANRWAKKHPVTEGVFLLDDHSRAEVLQATEVGDLWGIGPNLCRALQPFGIHTAWDLACADPKRLRRYFNVFMERMVLELQGQRCFAFTEHPAARGMIQATRSFGRPVSSLTELEESIATYTSRAAGKLRRQGLLAQTVLVYARTGRHNPNLPSYSGSHMVALPHATADTTLLVRYAHQALRQAFRAGYGYKKAGVWLGELMPAQAYQGNLFSAEDSARTQQRMTVLDALNQRYGRETIRLAACGLQRPWAMKSSQRSPDYTSAWPQLVVAHAR